MHTYLKASLDLELRVQRGENFQSALAAISRSAEYGYLTQGERELIVWAFQERRRSGSVKPIRRIEHHEPGNRRKDVR